MCHSAGKSYFRCWVIVVGIEIFNSKHHLNIRCSETQLRLSLINTVGNGCARKLRSVFMWNDTAECNVSLCLLATQTMRPNSAARTGRVEGAKDVKRGFEAADFPYCSFPWVPHLQVALAAPGMPQVVVPTRPCEGPGLQESCTPPAERKEQCRSGTQELSQSLPHSL